MPRFFPRMRSDSLTEMMKNRLLLLVCCSMAMMLGNRYDEEETFPYYSLSFGLLATLLFSIVTDAPEIYKEHKFTCEIFDRQLKIRDELKHLAEQLPLEVSNTIYSLNWSQFAVFNEDTEILEQKAALLDKILQNLKQMALANDKEPHITFWQQSHEEIVRQLMQSDPDPRISTYLIYP